MKTTPWFEGNVKPVREDVYGRAYFKDTRYSYWNGEWWGLLVPSEEDAFKFREIKSFFQNLYWREIKK